MTMIVPFVGKLDQQCHRSDIRGECDIESLESTNFDRKKIRNRKFLQVHSEILLALCQIHTEL